MAPEMEHAYSGWTEHGLCEMHDFAVANAEVTGAPTIGANKGDEA